MATFAFVLIATILEATGDATLRVALHHSSWPARIGLFAAGAVLLTLYGTFLNLSPVDFATVTGVYLATLFVIFQIVNYVFFRAIPTPAVLVGGTLMIAGGVVISVWR